jgi:hypothetical protein
MESTHVVLAAVIFLVSPAASHTRGASDDSAPPAEKKLPTSLQKCAVAHFPFDGHSRETLSGIETMTFNVEYADGRIGKAAVFNGKNAVLAVRENPKLHFKDSFSFAFWIWCQNEVKNQVVLAKSRFMSDQYSVAVWKETQLAFVFNNRDSWKTADQRLSKRSWDHVVVMGTSRQNARLFINGKEDRNSPFQTGHAFDDNRFPIAIGATVAERNPQDDFFEGMLDDLWMFDRALTPEEVTLVYRMGVTLPKGQHQVRAQLSVPAIPTGAIGGFVALSDHPVAP